MWVPIGKPPVPTDPPARDKDRVPQGFEPDLHNLQILHARSLSDREQPIAGEAKLRVHPSLVRTDPLKLKAPPLSINDELVDAILEGHETHNNLTELAFRALNVHIEDLSKQFPKKNDAARAIILFAWENAKIFALVSTAVTMRRTTKMVQFINRHVPALWHVERLNIVSDILKRLYDEQGILRIAHELGIPFKGGDQRTGWNINYFVSHLVESTRNNDKLGELLSYMREKHPAALASAGL